MEKNSKLGFVPRAPVECISIGESEVFLDDHHPDKLNLGIDAYCVDSGRPYTLNVVRQVLL